jgi:hypothetical protein
MRQRLLTNVLPVLASRPILCQRPLWAATSLSGGCESVEERILEREVGTSYRLSACMTLDELKYFTRNLQAPETLQTRPHVAMDGLFTPVSTSYKSSDQPVEDDLYVYLLLHTPPALRHPTCEQTRHQIFSLDLLIVAFPNIMP